MVNEFVNLFKFIMIFKNTTYENLNFTGCQLILSNTKKKKRKTLFFTVKQKHCPTSNRIDLFL